MSTLSVAGINNLSNLNIGNISINTSSINVNGAIYANGGIGTNGQVLVSNGSYVYWANASGGAVGANNDQVFYLNGTTVTANYAIPSNYNALSGGPITINSGVYITIPSGSYWTVT